MPKVDQSGEDFSGSELALIYSERFTDDELRGKRLLWETLCRGFFDRYVAPTDTVLDLGAGSCEYINAARAARKIAVDLNPDTKQFAAPDVEVLQTSSEDLSALADGSVDAVFTSNFFEHLPSKRSLMLTLAQCHRVLRPGGKLLVLMPNIRYLPGAYWDYFDHHLPLTHLSLTEALGISGYAVDEVIGRFLPYTVKNSPVPVRPWLVRGYLALRPAWRLLGKQMFVAAHKPA